MTTPSSPEAAQSARSTAIVCLSLVVAAMFLRGWGLSAEHSRLVHLSFWWSVYQTLPNPGADAPLQVVLWVPALAFLGYVWGWNSLRRSDVSNRRKEVWVALAVAAATVACLLQTTFFSSDLYYYEMLGNLRSEYGANAYLTGLSPIPAEQLGPYFPFGLHLANLVVYGPLLVLFYGLCSTLSLGNLAYGILLLKVIAWLSFIGTVALVSDLLGPERRWQGLFLLGLNPLLLFELVAEAHNDGMLVFQTVLGVWLAERGYKKCGTFLLVALIFQKITMGLVLLFFLAHWWHKGERRLALLAAFSALVPAAISLAVFGPHALSIWLHNMAETEKLFTLSFLSSLLYTIRGLWSAVDPVGVPKVALALGFFYTSRVLRFGCLWPLKGLGASKKVEDLFRLSAQGYFLLYFFGTMFCWPHYYPLPMIMALAGGRTAERRLCIYLSLAIPYFQIANWFRFDFAQQGYLTLAFYFPAVWMFVRTFRPGDSEKDGSHVGGTEPV